VTRVATFSPRRELAATLVTFVQHVLPFADRALETVVAGAGPVG
jgi:hypothetical protein